MKHPFLLALLLLLSKVGLSQSVILPAPGVYKAMVGEINLGNELSFDSTLLVKPLRNYMQTQLKEMYGISCVFGGKNALVQFQKLNNAPTDFYSINIGDNVKIRFTSEASCFYAFNSLFQLINGEKEHYIIQRAFVQDAPKFQWRGLHLDVSRHFFTVEQVKKYIDLMAFYKFNTFHWHLTDDQGWRIEIKKYPKLTEVGAWRDSTVENHYTTSPRTYSKNKYGGFYTQEQIKEVVKYAQDRYVTIVPEIEMPGHSRAALAAYPQFSCTIEEQGVPGLWGVFDDIFCSKEESIHFLQDILDEVLVLFPSQYIHVGGDEAPKARWTKCKKCQAVMRENGIPDEHHLQSYFIQQMDKYLTKNGRKLIGWDEILEGGLSDNAAVMSWRGFEGGIDAAKKQHFVVMSPGSHCYFDHYQSTNSSEPIAIGGYTPIEKVYDFNPIPEKLPSSYHAYILGGQANLWTEYIPTMEKLEYMAYPRAIALSQALWCQEKPKFEEFKQAFQAFHVGYLKQRNVNFSRALFYPSSKLVPTKTGMKLYVKDEDQTQDFQLNYKNGDNGNIISKTIRDLDSMDFNRTEGSTVEKITVELTSPLLKDPAKQVIYRHPALGLPITFITKPSPQYSSNGSLTLVDGVYGKLPWKGYEWLGFDTSTIEFVVDLTQKSTIEGASIHFLDDTNSWIYAPENCEISISKNGKKWSKPTGLTLDKSTVKFQFNQKMNGRYVKFHIKNRTKIPVGSNGEGNTPWTFIDEINIYFK